MKNTPQNIKIVKTQIIPALDIKIATGEIYKKKPKTFEYYGELFIGHKDSNKSFLLKKGYYDKVIDFFGGCNIDNITKLDIKKYLISLNIKNKSKIVYKSCIKEIFELAVDDGVLSFNPALSIKLKADDIKKIQPKDNIVSINKLAGLLGHSSPKVTLITLVLLKLKALI